MKKCVIITNPVAGRYASRLLRHATEFIGCAGYSVDIRLTECIGDGTRLARECALENPDLVLAAGGDGTLNEVVNGLVFTEVPFAVLPRGTVNVFAREIGLPRGLERQLQVVCEGRRHRVCLGKANNRFFLLMAGVGFDANVVEGVSPRLKRRIGRLAYVVSGFRTLFRLNPPMLDILVDGEERLAARHLIVGNGRFYGGSFKVTPDASIRTPALDFCAFVGASRIDFMRYAWAIALFDHRRMKDVICRRCLRLTVQSGGRVPVQVDGDIYGELPMTFETVPDALTVIGA
jgi:diacylglycerol kinase (ATP)